MKHRNSRILLAPGFLFALLILTSLSSTRPEHRAVTVAEEQDRYYYKNYHCFDFVKRCELEILKLTGFDTLVYVSSSQAHGLYEEMHGKLSKINDSIYFVQPYKHLVQNGNGAKPFDTATDSIFFYCDSELIGSRLTLGYLNGQTTQHKVYATTNRFWVNEKYFNKTDNRLYLSLNVMNPVVKENVEIVSNYSNPRYSIIFRKQRSDAFYIIVRDRYIKTLNVAASDRATIGIRFNLERMTKGTKLPGERKLYD